GVTNRGLYLAMIRHAQGEARYGINYGGCNGFLYNRGACLSEAGAAGITPQQVWESFINAVWVLTSAVPVGGATGIGDRAAARLASGALPRVGNLVSKLTGAAEEQAGGGSIPGQIFREGTPNPSNLRPRPSDQGVLSFRDSLSNPWTPPELRPPNWQPVFRPGEPYFSIDTSQLPPGAVYPDYV